MRPLLHCAPLLVAALASAQGPTPKAKPEDVKSPEAILSALYRVISGPAGTKHDWDRFRSLFAVDGRLIGVGAKAGRARYRSMTPDEYVRLSGPYIEQNGFFEKEIARRTEQYANIAHVFSTYESRNKADDKKPFERGINSIELFNDGDRWWIVSVYWQGEDRDHPLPDKYLHGGS